MKIDIQTFVIKFSKDNENLDRVQGSEVRPLVLDLTLQVLNASFIVLHIAKHVHHLGKWNILVFSS